MKRASGRDGSGPLWAKVPAVAIIVLAGALTVFPEHVEPLIGPALTDILYVLLAPLGGWALWVAIGNHPGLGILWAIPLAVTNAVAIYLLPPPLSLIGNFVVIVAVAMMLFSRQTVDWWYALIAGRKGR